MNLLGKVRRLHYRDGLNLSEIERRTGLTRKTIRKWLKAPEGVEPNYRRKVGETKIGPFAERLVKMLEMDARRPVRDRRTALKLHAELKQLGFDGDYSRVTEFIRKWREGGGAAVTKAFVPLQFAPGEAHQFDWSEEHLVIGGVWRKLTVAHLKLCYSKTFVVQAYPAQSHEMLFDAHARAFAALGGIPRRKEHPQLAVLPPAGIRQLLRPDPHVKIRADLQLHNRVGSRHPRRGSAFCGQSPFHRLRRRLAAKKHLRVSGKARLPAQNGRYRGASPLQA